MKKFNMNSDSALKFISVFFAICLWFYVVQVENPDVERTIKNVPVVFAGQEELADKKLITLNDNEQTVDIKIQGSRKYVMDTNSKNLIVRADVSSISSIGNHPVVVSVVAPYADVQIVDKNPASLMIEVDQLVSVEKPVSINFKGSPRSSYAVGNLTASPEKVTVTGPKTIVDSVQSVAATVDVSGKNADVVATLPFVAVGTNNTEIDTHLLTYSVEQVEVHAEILKTKTVPLQAVFSDALRHKASELQLDEGSIRQIKIAGVQSVIENVTVIRTKPITSSALGADNEATVELVLPPGVRSVDGEKFTLRFVKKEAE